MAHALARQRKGLSVRVLVVPNEVPWPANSGGRVDVARRLGLLKSLGVQTALLSWFDEPREGPPAGHAYTALHAHCEAVHLSPIRRSGAELCRRLAWLGRLPSHAAARWVTLDHPAALRFAQAFAPDVLLLDGLYGAPVVRWLSAQLGVPWVYRAHNVEHLYMRRQRQQASSWRARWGITANLIGLRRLEQAVLRDARKVLDISPTDAVYWQQHGLGHVQWLPAMVDAAFASALARRAAQPPDWDVMYFGNLHTPNNVAGLRWLIADVLPLLGARPLRIALAGSRPSEPVRALAAQDGRISLLADPPDMATLAGSARVLVNPVLAGSGVNLKSIEMLFSDAHLVSTTAGVQGLSTEAAACFQVARDAPAFARALLQALDGPPPDAAQRALRAAARSMHEAHALGESLLSDLFEVSPP